MELVHSYILIVNDCDSGRGAREARGNVQCNIKEILSSCDRLGGGLRGQGGLS